MASPISFRRSSSPNIASAANASVISASTNNASPPFDTTVEQALQRIGSDEFAAVTDSIRAARAQGNELEVTRLKSLLPAFLPSGRFVGGKAIENLVSHSGIVALDIDDIGPTRAAELRDLMRNDPHVKAAFISAGGNLAVLLSCDRTKPHEESARVAKAYAERKYGVTCDAQCKNVNRLRYFSCDPDIHIATASVPLPYPFSAPTNSALTDRPALTAEDIRELLRSIEPRPGYEAWIRVIAAVRSSGLPESVGISLLKEWSPEESHGEYATKWAGGLDEITVGTLVYLAQEGGWTPSAAFKRKLPEAAIREAARLEITAMLARREFGVGAAPVRPVPRFTINGVPVSTPGNITSISAQAKSGKSAVIGAFIASAVVADAANHAGLGTGPDTLCVSAAQPGDRKLIHIDTEQSAFDHWQHVQRALRRAGTEIRPPWLRSFGLAGATPRQLCEAVRVLCETEAAQGGIFAIIIDGVADLVGDVNEAEDSNALIAELHSLAIKHECPVITVVHENPAQTNGKSRGHLGSQLERKAETNLRLIRNGDIVQMSADKTRGAPIPQKTGPCFEWNDAAGMHVTVPNSVAAASDRKTIELRELAEECLEEGMLNAKSYVQLRAAIMAARSVGAKTAERRITAMKQASIILQDSAANLYYRLPQS